MNNFALALLGFLGLMALSIVAGRIRLVLTLYRVRMAPLGGGPLFDDVAVGQHTQEPVVVGTDRYRDDPQGSHPPGDGDDTHEFADTVRRLGHELSDRRHGRAQLRVGTVAVSITPLNAGKWLHADHSRDFAFAK